MKKKSSSGLRQNFSRDFKEDQKQPDYRKLIASDQGSQLSDGLSKSKESDTNNQFQVEDKSSESDSYIKPASVPRKLNEHLLSSSG